MPTPVYGGSLKASGAAVVITAEACTSLGGGVYRVTNAARRTLDPAASFVVKDNGVTVGAGFYTLDLLDGRITFSGYTPTGAITLDGSYLPVAAVAEVRKWSISGKRDLVDVTVLESGQARVKLPTLLDCSGSFESLALPTADLDAVTVGTQSLDSRRVAGTAMLLEINFGASYFRAWVLLESSESQADTAGVVTFTHTWQASPPRAGATFGFY